jgi:AAA15 family ATPase/GTPase
MKVMLKSFKFKGFKKFGDWVTIDFETNANKYQNKDYARKFKQDNNEVDFNSIIGIIGTNTSGKTSILEIIDKYTEFVNTAESPFTTIVGSKQFFHDRNAHDPKQQPRNFSELRGNIRRKMVWMLGGSDNFNVNCEVIEIVVELMTEGMCLTHNISFDRSGKYAENVFIKKRVNKNETTQQIFRKKPEQEINFKTFCNLIDNDEIVLSSRIPNVDNKDIKNAYEIIKTFSDCVSFVQSDDVPFLTLSANPYFNNFETEEELERRMKILEKIVCVIDKNVIAVRRNKIFDKRFNEFEYVLKGDVIVKEAALSTGTIKFTNIILSGLVSRDIPGDRTNYIMIDEIDNSWHPNLTRSFISLMKNEELLQDFNLICTFHNPYVSSEFREDALYVIDDNGSVDTWVQFINNYNRKNPDNKLRLEHSFQRKYLENLINKVDDNLDLNFLDPAKC